MSNIKDITGQRFGKLVAIRKTEERYHGSIVWECKCDCGRTVFVGTLLLRPGGTTSCGCAKTGKKALDLTGQRFGKLTAVRATDERRNGSVVWECKCDCGNTIFATARHLQNEHTSSCGCAHFIDITGQRFGQLTAIRPTKERKGTNVVWECKCDCGNTTFVSAKSLRSGNTKSCGCIKPGNKPMDLTGHRFGWLTAIEPTEKRMFTNVIWKCKCDCGNITYVAAHNLRSGGTQSCGCSKSINARGADEPDEN